jgi:ComF family protein
MRHHALPATLASQCELCRQWSASALVCGNCSGRYAAPRPRCRRCALPLGVAAERCGHCLAEAPAFAAATVAVDYDFPWDGLITAFKFRGRSELAEGLAALLAAAIGNTAAELVLPLPLSRQRLAERGFNQAWELARRVAAAQALPAHADVLLRLGDTAPQSGLGRAQRRDNLARVFMVDPARRDLVRGRHIALVDDVLTTGATASAAARELLRAGAASVQVWALARTPAPGADDSH